MMFCEENTRILSPRKQVSGGFLKICGSILEEIQRGDGVEKCGR
jgi:hypothetical protein